MSLSRHKSTRKLTIDPLGDLKSPSKIKVKGQRGSNKGKTKPPLEDVNPESATLDVSNTDAEEVSVAET